MNEVAHMRVGLFIPCYIDQLWPDVGMATVQVLERCGLEVDFPREQTCCGQPMANTGCRKEAKALAERFLAVFGGYETIVCPSGSCVSFVRHHYGDLVGPSDVAQRTFELCELLTDVVKQPACDGVFAHRVGLHHSCHGLRQLGLGQPSERVLPAFDKVRALLSRLRGIEIVEPSRTDECCGFGGTFSVLEQAVSCRMGVDRVDGLLLAGARVITATDASCLLHLSGIARRARRPFAVMHVAQILAGRPVPGDTP
jgi:L-lactate dehydrogenase complex protein LldE